MIASSSVASGEDLFDNDSFLGDEGAVVLNVALMACAARLLPPTATLLGHRTRRRAVAFSGTDANVVRRLHYGTWRTLIDNPFHDQQVGLVTPAPSE